MRAPALMLSASLRCARDALRAVRVPLTVIVEQRGSATISLCPSTLTVLFQLKSVLPLEQVSPRANTMNVSP